MADGAGANRAGSFFECTKYVRSGCHMPVGDGITIPGDTYAKRPINIYKAPKEHTRQQRQRDKAERKNQRKQEQPEEGSVDEMAELRQHAAEQAAHFNLGAEDAGTADESTGDRAGE